MKTKKKSVPVLRSRLMSAMRRTWRHSPEYKLALEAAKGEYTALSKLGKPMRRVHWLCASCGKYHPREGVQVDHKEPVVPLSGFDSWDGVIARLFCPATQLRVLCEACHDVVSANQREERQALKPKKEKVKVTRKKKINSRLQS